MSRLAPEVRTSVPTKSMTGKHKLVTARHAHFVHQTAGARFVLVFAPSGPCLTRSCSLGSRSSPCYSAGCAACAPSPRRITHLAYFYTGHGHLQDLACRSDSYSFFRTYRLRQSLLLSYRHWQCALDRSVLPPDVKCTHIDPRNSRLYGPGFRYCASRHYWVSPALSCHPSNSLTGAGVGRYDRYVCMTTVRLTYE
jgi:hypothetical protein